MDGSTLFAFSVSPWELVLRGTLIYVFLFLVFRFVLRRDAGSIGLSDFLFVVLIGDAAQNGMIGEATSSADSMLLIATLVGWNVLLNYLAYRWPGFERLAMGQRLCLFRSGQLNRRAMRRELITTEELKQTLHREGVRGFDEVDLIYLEASGEVTVIPKQPPSP
ncbi:YetF domain-containing protein [Ideonella sp. DXS29W]|uniref:YetF domain-containing protein n=1 Tax=Ideonella lacteola TaxID=2984193 RepID=A0ABU9BRP4_9BURK